MAICARLVLAAALFAPARAAVESESQSVWSSVVSTDAASLASLQRDLELGLWNARIHAVHGLEPFGSAGRPLLERAARDADWQVRLTAVHFLGRLGPAALPALSETLRDEPCRHVRITAIHWLGTLGPAASDALAEALGDESGMARLTGRYWLRKAGHEDYSPAGEGVDSEAAQREDLKACRPSRQPGRLALVKRLEAQPPPAQPAETVELELPAPGQAAALPAQAQFPPAESLPRPAADDSPSARERYAELDRLLADAEPASFLKPGRGAPETLPPGGPGAGPREMPEPSITQAATGPRPALRQGAVPPTRASESLPPGGPGVGMRPASSAQTALAEDHGRPKPENDPLPELIATLRQGDAPARARAADEVGKRGAGAGAAVPALAANLKHPNRRVRASAALALGNIGPAADPAVPALVRLLKESSEDVQRSAAVALGRLDTPRARRAFLRHLRDQAGVLARPGRTD